MEVSWVVSFRVVELSDLVSTYSSLLAVFVEETSLNSSLVGVRVSLSFPSER